MNTRQTDKAAATAIAARNDYRESVAWFAPSPGERRHLKKTATRAERRAARAAIRAI